MCIYLTNNRAKFHPDPIWNDRGFLKRLPQEEEEQKNKMSSDMKSIQQFLIQKMKTSEIIF